MVNAVVPLNWETFGEYAQALSQRKLGTDRDHLSSHDVTHARHFTLPGPPGDRSGFCPVEPLLVPPGPGGQAAERLPDAPRGTLSFPVCK